MKTTPTVHWLQQHCQNFILNEKWLVCHKTSTGQIWKDRINLSGMPSINLHSKTLGRIATSIAADKLCRNGITVLDRPKSTALLQDILTTALSQGQLTYFRDIDHVESLARLVQRTIHDLRMAGIGPDKLNSKSIQPSSKADDLALIYSNYCDHLNRGSLADLATCIDLSTQLITSSEYSLPTGLVILLPRQLELTSKEDAFLKLLGQRSQLFCFEDATTPEELRSKITQRASDNSKSFSYTSTQGDVNEVRHAAQQILGGSTGTVSRLDDVEFAYTDPSYAPLIYEYLTVVIERLRHAEVIEKDSQCPVTLGEGLPTVYARPGRALRAWLRWMRTDFVQSKAVQMVREGLLQRPETTEEIGYARLASNLREITIGFDRDRYLTQIQIAIQKAEILKAEFQKQLKNDPDEANADSASDSATGSYSEQNRDYGLTALRTLQTMFSSMLSVTPNGQDSTQQILAKSKRFLLHCARSESKLDREARNKLLDAIDGKLQSLELFTVSSESILSWLEELPLETSILVSGPQPGRIHVSRLSEAGFTGRKQVFVLGLDAGRFPRPASVDPLLLDSDRKRISDVLPTSYERTRLDQQSLLDLVARVMETPEATLHFSYSACDLIEDRQLSPSPALVDLFRLTQQNPRAHVDDIVSFIGPAVSFVSLDQSEWLDNDESFLSQLLLAERHDIKQRSLEQRHPHFAQTHLAQSQRSKAEFTAFDGLVPQAGADLDLTSEQSHSSSSRLETFGTCPRKFFFRYGLNARAPDEWSTDPQQWLEPLIFGSLVHELFEAFVKELTSLDLVPNLTRDKQRLIDLLHDKLKIYEQSYPCQNQDAKDRQIEQLESMCHIFLREEQNYCESTGSKPWVLEASFGLDLEPQTPLDCTEPIQLTLTDGRSLRAIGSPDRIDRISSGNGLSYTIWDYKSGSDSLYSFDKPFQQGRKLQSFLYVHMLRHQLVAKGFDEPKQIVFGYFFPSPLTQGNRIQWSISELKQGDSILQTICNTIADGIFPATTDKNDCTYCEYASVCGDAKQVAEESLRVASDPINRQLMHNWCQLREIKQVEAES